MKLKLNLEIKMNSAAFLEHGQVGETARIMQRATNIFRHDGLAVGYTETLRDSNDEQVGHFIVTEDK